MTDIHAKNNVEWTEEHVNLFTRNNVTNVAQCLVECKQLKFPSSNQIAKAERDIALLLKAKNKYIHNPRKR